MGVQGDGWRGRPVASSARHHSTRTRTSSPIPTPCMRADCSASTHSPQVASFATADAELRQPFLDLNLAVDVGLLGSDAHQPAVHSALGHHS